MNTSKNPKNKPQKSYNVKPKPIHYRVVKNLVETRGALGKAMIQAGYSEVTAKNPKNVTEAKGFIQAMNDAGLNLETLNTYLASDLKNKPKERLGELTLAYKLHGKLRETQTENKTLILVTSGESAERYQLPKP